jgi:glycine cleavage system H protein
MDGFTYYDIFQTKGIEYLIIIAFLLLLVPFWILVNKKKDVAALVQQSLGILTAAILKIPQGIFYSKNHTWTYLEKSGSAEIGIDDWLLHIAGKANFSQLKQVGDEIKKGELMTKIVSNGKTLRLYSPISGKVLQTNPLAEEVPLLISKQPYTEGWLYKLEPHNWKADTHNFYVGKEAKKWFNLELTRFKDFMAVSMGENSPLASMLILQDGGELRDQPLREFSEAIWNDFQKEFLDS